MLKLLLKFLYIIWLFFIQPAPSEDEEPLPEIPKAKECMCRDLNCWQGELGPPCGLTDTLDI